VAGDWLSLWVGAVSAASTRWAKFSVSVVCSTDLERRLGRGAFDRVAPAAQSVRAASFAELRGSVAFALTVMGVQPLCSPVQRVRRRHFLLPRQIVGLRVPSRRRSS